MNCPSFVTHKSSIFTVSLKVIPQLALQNSKGYSTYKADQSFRTAAAQGKAENTKPRCDCLIHRKTSLNVGGAISFQMR